MASRLDIKFIGEVFDYDRLFINQNTFFTFRNQRTAAFQVQLSSENLFLLGNFERAFNLDMNANGSGVFIVEKDTPNLTLTIIHPQDGYFVNASTLSGILLNVRNIDAPKPIDFITSFSQAGTDPCTNIKLTALADEVCDEIYFVKGNVVIGGRVYNTDTYSRDFKRGDVIRVVTEKDTINNEKYVTLPPSFVIERVIVEGSNIRIKPSTEDLTFSYAYGNEENYQLSPVFTSLTAGTYTAYLKDQYGCVKTLEFFIKDQTDAEFEVNYAPPYLDVPRINSIPFSDRRLPGIGETNNQFEFLSSEIPDPYISGGYFVPLNESGVTNIQFRSSYANNYIKAINCNGLEIDIPFDQKSEFINKVRNMDGNLSFSNGFLRISFTNGNTYDEAGNVNGTHNYNGSLPVDYTEGLTLFIDGYGQSVITRIESVNGIQYAVTNLTSVLNLQGVKITDIVKVYNFEVFEAYFQNDIFGTNPFYLKIGSNDLGVKNKTFVSEKIQVVEGIEEKKYHKINYFSSKNRENNDIHYQWGITHTRWIPFQRYLDPVPSADIEILQSDDRVNKKNYKAKRVYVMLTDLMPKMVADSLAEALNVSTTINVDGQDYINEENCELEIKGSQAILRVNLTVSNKMLNYGQDEGVFNNDQFYPVLTD
ncbi:hypothetical protein QO206_13335 [Leeuwenhoekiella aequorea]|uniref:hypothetical protein n=1 Tax=Leeuwenhoekiella aequorea TaxID=283736 RepID=UPI00352EAFA4|tara:strand:+ start:28282 stop:30228 length:1947 start_codon:yes stop_codon:yes gene_type:complete